MSLKQQEQIQLVLVSEMAGASTPEVPFAPGIDVSKLGDNPYFVTLPIARVGAKSENGRVYTESAVQQIVDQVNTDRPEGRWGHLKKENRDSEYQPPAIRWVGAVLAPDGTGYGKLMTLTQESQEYYENAEATQAKVCTSVYGWATYDQTKKKDVIGFDLETIDIADPKRAGIRDLAAVPVSEMEKNSMDPEEQIKELTTEMATLKQQVSELQADAALGKGLRELVSEYADAFVRAEININATGQDLVQVVQEMIAKLQSLQVEKLMGTANTVVGEMVKLEALRPIVAKELGIITPEQVGDKRLVAEMFERLPDEKTVKQRIEDVMKLSHIQTLAKALVQEQAGPGAVVSGQHKDESWRDDVVKGAEAHAKSIGAIN